MSRTWSDEQLSAMLDGELSAGEMRDLRADLSADAALATRLDRLRAANEAFVTSAAAIDSRPMPPALSLLLARLLASYAEPTAATPPEATPEITNIVPFRRRLGAAIVEHRAIAASLLCAAVLGSLASLRPSAPAAAVADDARMIASASPLGKVLDTGISATAVSLPAGLTATPRLSFQRADGRFCRQYRLSGPKQATDAIACRENEGWRTELLVFGPATPATNDYQSASGPAAGLLEAYVDKAIKGSPLNAADEAHAIANHWGDK